MKLIPHRLTGDVYTWYSEFVSIWYRFRSPHRNSALPPGWNHHRCASTHFGENQLAPGSIGISPLTTPHPPIFQHRSVRTSTRCYPGFILDMVRSPGFGSTTRDIKFRPIRTRFRCGCGCSCLHLPRAVTRRLILQQAHGQTLNRPPIACRLTVSCSISLPCSGFFSPFPRGTGSLSVTQEYLALRDGSR
jgi:hypothetical protein